MNVIVNWFLADRTADRRTIGYWRHNSIVCLSVTMCTVALRVSVGVESRHVPSATFPIHFFCSSDTFAV